MTAKEYLREIRPTNKPHTCISVLQAIKILLCICALVLAYLFALNGRYVKEDDEYYFDKWTKTILIIENYKEVEQK